MEQFIQGSDLVVELPLPDDKSVVGLREDGAVVAFLLRKPAHSRLDSEQGNNTDHAGAAGQPTEFASELVFVDCHSGATKNMPIDLSYPRQVMGVVFHGANDLPFLLVYNVFMSKIQLLLPAQDPPIVMHASALLPREIGPPNLVHAYSEGPMLNLILGGLQKAWFSCVFDMEKNTAQCQPIRVPFPWLYVSGACFLPGSDGATVINALGCGGAKNFPDHLCVVQGSVLTRKRTNPDPVHGMPDARVLGSVFATTDRIVFAGGLKAAGCAIFGRPFNEILTDAWTLDLSSLQWSKTSDQTEFPGKHWMLQATSGCFFRLRGCEDSACSHSERAHCHMRLAWPANACTLKELSWNKWTAAGGDSPESADKMRKILSPRFF